MRSRPFRPPVIHVPLNDRYWRESKPADIAQNLCDDDTFFWLDSGCGADGWSYLGTRPSVHPRVPAVFDIPIQRSFDTHGTADSRGSLPPFATGWLVHLDYPSQALYRLSPRAAIRAATQAHFFETILAYSHAHQTWCCVASPAAGSSMRGSRERAANLIQRSQFSDRKSAQSKRPVNPKFVSSSYEFSQSPDSAARAQYLSTIERCLTYICSGDIYQVNIAQCFAFSWLKSCADLYFSMRSFSPPSYGAYLGTGLSREDHAICCISPELFLKIRGSRIETRPIKGTRPRGTTESETAAARLELDASPKERAELNMIVDLERNDLGRVCEYGSVKVESAGAVEVLPTLLHRTARVSGKLRPYTTVGEVLEATFPGGSITGAPKLRAMEIIHELEPVPRGPYCGAIGWVGLNGEMDFNIAIRTAMCNPVQRTATYFAGSGIVADSSPQKEWDETILKAGPFLKAVQAQPGF